MLKLQGRSICRFVLSVLVLVCGTAQAATGEMGTGIPEFGIYSSVVVAPAGQVTIVSLASPTINFPAGCTSLTMTPASMGADAYKLAVATLLAAKVAGKPVRFYAHAARDAGCGVDYVQMKN